MCVVRWVQSRGVISSGICFHMSLTYPLPSSSNWLKDASNCMTCSSDKTDTITARCIALSEAREWSTCTPGQHMGDIRGGVNLC